MKPVYSNMFNVSHSKTKSEVTFSFAHAYTDHNFTMQNGALTDVSAQVVEEVASIVVPREALLAITKLLNRTVEDWVLDPSQL